MFYNARWLDVSLGRFAQADTIVPSGVQGYDRYAYVNNNPILYTDPSGHRPCGDEEAISCSGKRNGISLSDEERKKQSIRARYSVDIFGPWTLEGLTNLQASLDALASSMGGASQLNHWIAEASSGDKINFFYDIRGGLNNKAACGAHACWDSIGKYGLKDSIRVDDYAMSDDYLKVYLGRDPLRRPPGLGLQDQNSSKQLTLVHEMIHMLQTANPNALTAYKQEYANDPRMNDFGNTPSESMATSLAIYAVSGGASYPGYGKHTTVANTIFNNYFGP